MSVTLSPDQKSTVTVLLQAGKNINEISKFAELDTGAVTGVARELDITPSDPTQMRAKELFGSNEGLSYAEVAKMLQQEGLTNGGESVHYLTVSSWVANHGWAWGGSPDGEYTTPRSATSPAKSRFTLRMSKTLDEDVNGATAIAEAADAAWNLLQGDDTRIVAVAVVKGAASAGVTDIAGVKGALMERHGEAIRSAKA
ncbi:MAG: hypothetical protein AAF567_19685 [Actinomycetota bacterium]